MMESQVDIEKLEHGTKEERKAAADKLSYDSEKMQHPDVQKSGDSAYVGGDMGRYVSKLDVSAPLLSCCLGSGCGTQWVAEVLLLHKRTASSSCKAWLAGTQCHAVAAACRHAPG